jgi:hypothetical protein
MIPEAGPKKVFKYAYGKRKSSKRKALTALNPKTLPIIDAVKLAIEPSSNKSHSYAMNAKNS